MKTEECDIQRIASTFRQYESGTLEDIKGFCAVKSLEDIAAQDFVLSPGRYVGIADEEEDSEPFNEKMTRLVNELDDLFSYSNKLELGIREQLIRMGYQFNSDSNE